jgi:hypothetical protein
LSRFASPSSLCLFLSIFLFVLSLIFLLAAAGSRPVVAWIRIPSVFGGAEQRGEPQQFAARAQLVLLRGATPVPHAQAAALQREG